jgi:hypothetical protein
MKNSPQPGKPSRLSKALHAQLNMYAIAASAAGVGALALAQPAAAKVVYTPTHQLIGANGVFNVDLNKDGTVDFLIQQWNYGNWSSNNQLLADPAVGNGVVGKKYLAAALLSGVPIGPSQNFIAGGSNGEIMLSVSHFTTGGTSYVHGSWANVRNRYLGLKFQIRGETHYGWARLSVQRQQFHFTALLTGYAYETAPNTAIKAGQTSDDATASSANPSSESRTLSADTLTNTSATPPQRSLGDLALGAQARPAGRQP